MNQTHSRIRVSYTENLSPSIITTYPDQDNNDPTLSPHEQASTSYAAKALYMTFTPQDQYDNINYNMQSQTAPPQQIPPVHPKVFFYRPPNDFLHYYVDCKEICYDTVAYLLNKSLQERNTQSNENECIFYYKQQHDARFYQVSCEIVSPLLINNCLNKNFLGFELQNAEQEHLAFTFDQKENLKSCLRQYLGQYLLN
ncbi:unnamed protein product [Rhizophagus irregularis]|uniref:Uncharacterized protein n=1 Tax=Rhizophagus irregularis TaxID=588596 RepID=A0A2I1H0P6_9GLOM|nr:hypothetical protein RhiirA4_496396 [Rhizophagus irregularis]CAB4443178.1 unnamed protein product [Rhizophagus irregularis]CAB4443239.1 unnamed protein product [Rhizophagus irregularis]